MILENLSGYISLEFFVDYGFTSIVEERFDAGIRLGGAISKDMVAVRISPDWRLAVVGSPADFKRRPPPVTPHDLTSHACVNTRHRPSGAIYAREFERDGKVFTVKDEGQRVFSSIVHVLNGALDGIGLAYVPESLAAPYLADGRLEEVMADRCPCFSGFRFNTRFAAEAVLRSCSASC